MSGPASHIGDEVVCEEVGLSSSSDGPIVLVDHTKSIDEDVPREAEEQPIPQSSASLSKKLTGDTLRLSLRRQKYKKARWQKGRPKDQTTEVGEDSHRSPSPDDGQEEASRWGEGRLRRRRRKVEALVRTPRSPPKIKSGDPDSHVDILYENQRGFFFAGIPHFSSNSLLNFDPTAWLDANFKPSAVDITNSQVPDPSWYWAWRAWYVDMSYDVDEEGWEYSFWFGHRCAWHGTHPWFHSFVRRRRWLRQRTRRHANGQDDAQGASGHTLNADYFTIHSQPRRRSVGSDLGSWFASQSPRGRKTNWGAKSWDEQGNEVQVQDMPTLMKYLKESAIDREKMFVIRRFLDQGGDELYYLAERMPDIMGMLVFQSSRQQLLASLKHRFNAAQVHRQEHQSRGEPEDEHEEKTISSLLGAVEAADEQCKQLEFWSDIRFTQDAAVMGAEDHGHDSWNHEARKKELSEGNGKGKANVMHESTAGNIMPPASYHGSHRTSDHGEADRPLSREIVHGSKRKTETLSDRAGTGLHEETSFPVVEAGTNPRYESESNERASRATEEIGPPGAWVDGTTDVRDEEDHSSQAPSEEIENRKERPKQ